MTPSDRTTRSDSAGFPRRHGRWVHWLSALLIFCAGLVIGSGGTIRMIQKRIAEHHRKPPGHAVEHIMHRMERELDLRDDQYDQVRAVVVRRLTAMRDIRDEAMPRVAGELLGARDEIVAVLDPDQEREFRKAFSRLEALLPPSPVGRGEVDSP